MSYVHPLASFLTPDTIRLGVKVGPDGNDRRSVCPVARILTEVPPTSTTSTFLAENVFATRVRVAFMLSPLSRPQLGQFLASKPPLDLNEAVGILLALADPRCRHPAPWLVGNS